jgi:WD40 repeat protein
VAVAVFHKHQDYVYAVAFSPGGTRLASAGDDLHVMVWNLTAEGKMEDQESPSKDMADDGIYEYIRGVVFTPNGSNVISVCSNGTVAIWSLDASEKQLCRIIRRDREQSFGPGPFKSMWFERDHPEVLLTEFGAWPVDINQAATSDATTDSTSTTLSPPPRHQNLPDWSPFSIGDKCKSITRHGRQLICCPSPSARAITKPVSCGATAS